MSDLVKPRYDITVVPPDGNALSVVSATAVALRRLGVSQDEIVQYRAAALSGDYNHLLRVTSEWVNLDTTEDADDD